MKNYNLLLLTSAIKSINFSNKEQMEKRLKDYLKSINYYLNNNNINGIVFIDSQGFNFLERKEFSDLQAIANNKGKDLELLTFNQDIKKLIEINYGYGEFQTLEYMNNNSKLLKKVNSFYKVSGRYIIENISEIIKITNNYDNLIYKFGILDYHTYMTLFFKINKNELNYISNNYKKLCSRIQLNSEKELHSIMIGEYIFFELLYNNFKLNTIKIYPKYNTLTKKKYIILTFLLKIGYLNINNLFIKNITFLINKLSFNLKLKYLKLINIIASKIWS